MPLEPMVGGSAKEGWLPAVLPVHSGQCGKHLEGDPLESPNEWEGIITLFLREEERRGSGFTHSGRC